MNRFIRLVIASQVVLSLFTFTASAVEPAKDVDNTAQNQRDRNHQEVTPADQSNRDEDRMITKRIRQAIMAEKSLSVNAHNVKIITANGRVTLRGPVKTEDEKNIIHARAVEVATAENVENKLEVKANN